MTTYFDMAYGRLRGFLDLSSDGIEHPDVGIELDEDERRIAAVRVGRWAFEHAYRATRDFEAAQQARREAIAAVTKEA